MAGPTIRASFIYNFKYNWQIKVVKLEQRQNVSQNM